MSKRTRALCFLTEDLLGGYALGQYNDSNGNNPEGNSE